MTKSNFASLVAMSFAASTMMLSNASAKTDEEIRLEKCDSLLSDMKDARVNLDYMKDLLAKPENAGNPELPLGIADTNKKIQGIDADQRTNKCLDI